MEVLTGRKIKLYRLKFGCGVILKACLAYPEVSCQQSHGQPQGTMPWGAASAHQSLGELGLSQGDKLRSAHWECLCPLYSISQILGTIPTQDTFFAPRPFPAGQAPFCSPGPVCPAPAWRVMHTPCRTSQTTNWGYVCPTTRAIFSFTVKQVH